MKKDQPNSKKSKATKDPVEKPKKAPIVKPDAPKKPGRKKKPKPEPIEAPAPVITSIEEPIEQPNLEPVIPTVPEEPVEVKEVQAIEALPSPGFDSVADDPSPVQEPIQKTSTSPVIPFIPKPKFDIKTWLIIALGLIVLLMGLLNGCNDKPEPGKTVKIDGKKYDVIQHDIDTFIEEKTVTVTKKGKDIYHDTTIYVEVPQAVDTGAILRDYYAKKVKKDSLALPDSSGYVKVTDTLFKNDILTRNWEAVVLKKTIVEKMILREQARNQIYLGMTAGFNKTNLINYVGPTILLKTKKDRLYSAGFGYTGSGAVSLQGGVYWKIKLKK